MSKEKTAFLMGLKRAVCVFSGLQLLFAAFQKRMPSVMLAQG